MQDKIIFREMLSEIKELADQRGNRLTTEEVQEFFANARLEEEQLKLIYEYLLGEKIQVIGYESETERKQVLRPEDGQEDQEQQEDSIADHFVQLYAQELEGVTCATEEEELRLFLAAAGGDELARGRLVELHLKTVYELSMTYLGQELPQSDLIQEGNVALLLAMGQLPGEGDLMDYRRYLFEAVQEAMEEALEGHRDRKELEEEIAGKANYLQEAVKNLEEELEHKVSVEELSAYLEMPLEEIRDILRMAGEEIEVEGNTKEPS